MDIFFPHTLRERAAFKESAVKCGFVELIAETTANVGILPADERISTLLMAWKNIGNFLTKNPYNQDVGITVSWVGRCTLNLWFGREWIACAIENKTDLIEQMMKVYPTAFITMHPYSWPYMFSIYRDPWMVEYLNLNFQRMSGPDLTPILEPKDSEFIQQEGIPLLILRMVNMFDFRMVKLVKYMCLRLLLTWQDENSEASKTLRASPNADQYIDYARHIYLLAICENNGFKDLHYTLETIQRLVHCDLTETWPLELGAQAIAKGLQQSNMTLTELLIAFLFKVPKLQFGNIFGAALTKYIYFITEYQLKNINRLSSVKLTWPLQEVYSKLVEMFITHRESSEELIKGTSKLSEQIFLGLHNLTASKCAYELIKQRPHAEWHTSKITLLLTIISEEVNVIQDYKYNDVQSTDELIEKEKEVAIYYRDLAKLFHKSPYLEQEAWLTTFSLHPCREFMDAVTRCGARNLRAIKKQAHKLKVIEVPEPKTKTHEEDTTSVLKEEDKEKIPQEAIVSNLSDDTVDLKTVFLETLEADVSTPPQDQSKADTKTKTKRLPRKKLDKNEPKKIEPKTKISLNMLPEENESKENKTSSSFKRGRPVGALGKDKSRSKSLNPTNKPPARKSGEKPDLAEEIFAAAAGAAENINNQTAETIKYPAFALMNSVTDTEELMKFTNYDEAYEQYTELNKILSRIKLNDACYEDLLTLLIAPRYKRLTWAVSWKKLKKRCRFILTKDNKKRELVEQSMADANDRLTHLNIDYEKYKDKPQIDYGTIEGGYECYDTDSDDEDLKKTEMDLRKTKERPAAKKIVTKLVGSSCEDIQIKGEEQNPGNGIKPILKIENVDSSTSNLLNIIESTHLSKPVYLNKPVYFVRNPLASPSTETAISLETGLENQALSRTSSRRSTGEETLTSDSFEEHHWHLTTAEISGEMRRDSQEQTNNISGLRSSSSLCTSFLKTETAFNIPASIQKQLEQPTMFFKSEPKNESNAEVNACKQTDLSEAMNFSPPNVTKIYNHTSPPNQIKPVLIGNSRFSPKLFEDMPEDLTMPKTSTNNLYETQTPLSNVPLNLTSRLVSEPTCKTTSVDLPPNQIIQCIERPLKKGKKQPLRSLTKINSRKRQTKEGRQYNRKEIPQGLKTQRSNTQPSVSQESLTTPPTPSLKSIRIFPHNKNSKAVRINPTAAVVFSSAAASYHRTPFLNVAQQEPNILQKLLSKEITPFGGIAELFDKTTTVDADAASKSEDETNSAFKIDAQLGVIAVPDAINTDANSTLEVRSTAVDTDAASKKEDETNSAFKIDAQLGVIAVPDPINTAVNSTSEVQNTNVQSLLSAKAETSNSEINISGNSTAAKIIKQISPSNVLFCDSEKEKLFDSNTNQNQALQNNLTADAIQNISICLKDSEKAHKVSDSSTCYALIKDESENIALDDAKEFSSTGSVDCELAANDFMKSDQTIDAFNLSNKSEEFEFKVPAAVAKPCFFMRSKPKKIISYASDWVKNITFNDKTAEIFVSESKTEKVSERYVLTDNTEEKAKFEDEKKKKLSRSDGPTTPTSQNQSDDILYDKHIVFNKKLLDPHLKTYKNTKASCKVTDTKKLKEHFSESDDLFSGNSEESNGNGMEKNHKIKEKDKTSSLERSVSNVLSTSPHRRQSLSPLASTSQNTVDTPRTLLESAENLNVKTKKKRNRQSIPSTKKFDQMFEWIEMVTTANREPVPESIDTSDTLLNLFSAQLMNQAKSIHFNYEYLREKEILSDRANDERVNCEASILIASPGPSEDCVKLIKAFKKNTVFKGVDMSSNEVSFTSSLAKEVLGKIVKVTLNESKDHASCCGNHFDASDALDEFIRSRRDANSPTFYSPTLSIKHLRNGTLANSVESIDTSLEKLIPKPGRKRSLIPARSPVKKRIRKKQSVDNTNAIKCKQNSFDEANPLPLKQIDLLESVTESTIPDILTPSNKCSIMENTSVFIDRTKVTKPLVESPLEQRSFDFVHLLPKINTIECDDGNKKFNERHAYEFPVEIKSKDEYSDTQTILNEDHTNQLPIITNSKAEYSNEHTFLNEDQLMMEINSVAKLKLMKEENISDICVTQKEPSQEISEKEKSQKHVFDSQEIILDSELNNSTEEHFGEEKLMDDESIDSKAKKANIKRYPHDKSIPIERIQIEQNNSTRRNIDEGIHKKEMMSVSGLERKQCIEEHNQLPESEKSGIVVERSTKYSTGNNSSDEAKHLTEKDKLNLAETNSSTKENTLLEEIQEATILQTDNYSLKETNEICIPDETNEICIPDETKQLLLGECASLDAKLLLEDEQMNTEKKTLEKPSQPLAEEIQKNENSEDTNNQPVVEEIEQFPVEIRELKYPLVKMSSEEDKQSAVKKRIIKPRISYAELDSDSDDLPKSRLKIPSLKINFPPIRPVRKKSLNRSITKKTISNKSSGENPSKRIQKISKEIRLKKTFEVLKTNPSTSLNDSDDDKPLSSNINKTYNEKESIDSDADYGPTKSNSPTNESDDDAPLKRIHKKLPSKKSLPPLKTKKNTKKVPVRKKFRNAYSPKRPSVRIQSKISRPRTTSLNYFALFLSDSDEDEPVKSKRRRCTPDRLWTQNTVKKKAAKESIHKKISHQRKLRCSRVAIKQVQSRKHLQKPKTPTVKMPVLTREDSDHTVEENIYECATMSTANETDEDACSDHRPKRRRQKVVKPMRIRCVSRRAIPTDVITESSSNSSLATVQTARELGSYSSSSFPKRGRLLRRKTLEKNLLMSKLLCESSSSSSPVMMNRPKRQFAAKSTSKPPGIIEHDIYDKPKQTVLRKCSRSVEPLTFMEKEAIHNHNCVNFQIRLQRLTANEAILCRKPCIRLDRNFVENYFADKNLEYKEELESEGLRDDNK